MDESAPINTIGDDYIDIIGNKIMYIKISSIFSKIFTINLFICKNYYIIIHN